MLKKFKKQIIIAVILGFLVSSIMALMGDYKKTTQAILSFNYWYAIPILFLSLVNYIFRFFRWHYFLSVIGLAKKLKISDSALIFFSGISMTVTPGKAGELIKSYFLKKILKNHISETVPVIVTERLTDGLAALLLMTGGLAIYRYGIPVFILSVIGSFSFLFILQQKRLCLFLLHILGKINILSKFITSFGRFYETSYLLVQWKHILVGIALGVVAWGAEAFGFYLVLVGIGVHGDFINLLFSAYFIFCFAGVIGFATLLPAGIGVTEGTTSGLLIYLLSIDKSVAIGATLLNRFMTLWFGVTLGFIALLTLIRKLEKKYD